MQIDENGRTITSNLGVVTFSEFLWIWNQQQTQMTPRLHVAMSRWISRQAESQHRKLLLLAFRNSGKSTLVGAFCAWSLYRNPNVRILVLAGDFGLAKKMVRNVKRIIESHILTRDLKPVPKEQWASDQFTVRRNAELRDPSMLAKGMSSNITGLRADIVICDDVEVPNTCDTKKKRIDLRARLREVEYVLVPGGLQLLIGTPHNYYSIYADAPRREIGEHSAFLDGFQRLEVPIVNEKGESSWPERFPIHKIEELRSRTGPNKFESQMLLRPRNQVEARLNPDLLRSYDNELTFSQSNSQSILRIGERRMVSASCWWDPAYGEPGKGNASVVAVVFADEEGYYWLHRIQYLTFTVEHRERIDEATQLCRDVAVLARDLHLPAINVEINGIGRFLPSLLRRELRALGIGAAVIEKVSTRQKDMRILDAFDSVLAAQRLWVHESVWKTPFVREVREWQPGLSGQDDGLDAVAGCLLSEPVRLQRLASETAKPSASWTNWRGFGSVVHPEYEFDV
jgi:hypothetical protein